MKICYIADQGSIHTQRWLRYFAAAGHDIFLMPHSESDIKIDTVNILDSLPKLSYKSLNFYSTIKKAKAIIDEIKPDILHAHFVEQFGWLGALVDYHPFVLTAWGTDIFELPHVSRLGIGKKLTQFALKKADMMTAISNDLKRAMTELGAEKENIAIIHWGVDLDIFRPNRNVSQMTQSLRLGNNPIILSNRYFEKHYNIDIIIKAVARVVQKIPSAVLVLQNPGGKLVEDIKILIRELGINESVRIIPRYNHADMPALYALADIYVSVPSWDAACISLTEAMACGAVPVISQVAGPMEWVRDEENGKVVPVRNVETLADAICDLIRNPQKRELFITRNLDLIRQKGDHNYWMEEMSRYYNSLLNGTGHL
jgi:glycosyltransferase involved in cell wall biosynthesis